MRRLLESGESESSSEDTIFRESLSDLCLPIDYETNLNKNIN